MRSEELKLGERSSLNPLNKIKNTLHNWKLVLQRVSNPTKTEYFQAIKIVWLAIAILAVISYLIHIIAVQILSS